MSALLGDYFNGVKVADFHELSCYVCRSDTLINRRYSVTESEMTTLMCVTQTTVLASTGLISANVDLSDNWIVSEGPRWNKENEDLCYYQENIKSLNLFLKPVIFFSSRIVKEMCSSEEGALLRMIHLQGEVWDEWICDK